MVTLVVLANCSSTCKLALTGRVITTSRSRRGHRASARTLLTRRVTVTRLVAHRWVKVKITRQGALTLTKPTPLTSAFRVVATLGATQTLYFDVILVGSGKTLAEITLSSFRAAIPAKVEAALAALVARRIRA